MSNLATLGYIGRGIQGGLADAQQMQSNDLAMQERRQRMTLADADAQWQQTARTRQQQQWQQDDAAQADLLAARQAGAQVLHEERQAYDNDFHGPLVKAPYSPRRDAILRAAQVETDELFKRGRTDVAIERWNKAEAMRSQLRAQAAQDVMAAMAGGRDITAKLKRLDSLADDGLEVDGDVKMERGPDGNPIYTVVQKNRFTGERVEQPTQFTPAQFQERAMFMLTKPEDFAKCRFPRGCSPEAKDDGGSDAFQPASGTLG